MGKDVVRMALEMRPDTSWAEMARMVQRAMLERN